MFRHSSAVSYRLMLLNDSTYFFVFLTEGETHNGIARDLKWFPFNAGRPSSFCIKSIQHITCDYVFYVPNLIMQLCYIRRYTLQVYPLVHIFCVFLRFLLLCFFLFISFCSIWEWGYDFPYILNIATRWKRVVKFTPRPLSTWWRNSRYPLDGRPDESQSRSGRCREKKISCPRRESNPDSLVLQPLA